MFAWLNRWGKDAKAEPATSAEASASPSASTVAATLSGPSAEGLESSLWATHADTLAWALGMDVPVSLGATPGSEALTGAGKALLRHVDAVLAKGALPADLVPRAAAVIPQLLSLLRQDDLPVASIVERVVRDPLLTTEVMRLARSPHYRTRHRIETLEGAVTVLGASGLQAAIARVVLRPLFRGHSAGLLGRAAERAWPHASRQAELAAELAAARGLPRIDGFLAGLLHGSGRTALWRILDGSENPERATPPLPWDAVLYAELAERSHQLFGQLALDWRITPTLSETGQALRQGVSARESMPPLASVVLESALRCTQELGRPQEGGEEDAEGATGPESADSAGGGD